MIKSSLTLLLLFIANLSIAQIVLNNSNPSIQWKYIDTDRYRLIFSDEFSPRAQQVASLLDTLYQLEVNSLLKEPTRKIPFIIRDASAISNGFVALAPRRSEIYTMPSQDYNFLGTNDWLDKVITHEFRHVVQFDHARRGINKVLATLFGQNAWGGSSYFGAPQWFWEGDAILAETAFSRSGRGQITGYNSIFRMNLLEGRKFSYHKQYLRSYRDNVPNHYVLGSNFVPWLRKYSGDPEIWDKVTRQSFSFPFLPFRFSSSMKKHAGINLNTAYRTMMTELEEQWQSEIDGLDLSDRVILQVHRTKVYTDYLFPQPQDDGSVIVQKEGLGDIERFIRINEGQEERLFTPGIMNSTGMLSVRGGKIVWTEYNFNARYRVESYSVVKVYDIATAKLDQLSWKSRYSGADLSPDADRVVTVETDRSYSQGIVILDLMGNIHQYIPLPANNLFSQVRFLDSDHLIALRTDERGRSITRISLSTGDLEDLITPGYENVGHPVPARNGEYILFSSGVSGIDNIYALETSSGNILRVTSSRYGAFNPMPDATGDKIYYNELGALGMDVAEIVFEPEKLETRVVPERYRNPTYAPVIESEGVELRSDQLPKKAYEVKEYGPLKGLLNVHSWGPFVSTSLDAVDVGLFSRDIMSTASLYGGYTFDLDEERGKWLARFSYQRFYPIIDLEVSQGDRSTFRTVNVAQQNDPPDLRSINFEWQEKTVDLGIRIPLVLTRSRFLTSMQMSYDLAYTSVSDFRNDFNSNDSRVFYDQTGNEDLWVNEFYFSLINTLKMSRRDVAPRFGQFISFENYTTAKGLNGANTAIRTRWWFPGVGKHHSISMFWSYQNKLVDLESNNYWFPNRIDLPRGVGVSTFSKFYSMGINYQLPLIHPDLELGPLLYIKRIRLTGFMDYAYGSTLVERANNFFIDGEYLSAGAELRFDFHAARLLPEVDMGVRYSRDLFNNTGMFELIFPTIDF